LVDLAELAYVARVAVRRPSGRVKRRAARVAVALLCAGSLLVLQACAPRQSAPPVSSGMAIGFAEAGWTAVTFPGRSPTRYALLDPPRGAPILQARCDRSASLYVLRQPLSLTDTPVLRWSWRVSDAYSGIDHTRRGGDDFPARVYAVVGNPLAPSSMRAIVYVWAAADAPQQAWPNPYAPRAIMVPLRRGSEHAGEWVAQARDLRADFERYLGLDVDALDGVAVMSDCDDLGVSVDAAYRDIRLTSEYH